MSAYLYIVTLTNGLVTHKYEESAMDEETAVILAQAEAIKEGRGHKLLSITKVDEEALRGKTFWWEGDRYVI